MNNTKSTLARGKPFPVVCHKTTHSLLMAFPILILR
jgi:hypothetical protein